MILQPGHNLHWIHPLFIMGVNLQRPPGRPTRPRAVSSERYTRPNASSPQSAPRGSTSDNSDYFRLPLEPEMYGLPGRKIRHPISGIRILLAVMAKHLPLAPPSFGSIVAVTSQASRFRVSASTAEPYLDHASIVRRHPAPGCLVGHPLRPAVLDSGMAKYFLEKFIPLIFTHCPNFSDYLGSA